jgi:hypothetical protein
MLRGSFQPHRGAAGGMSSQWRSTMPSRSPSIAAFVASSSDGDLTTVPIHRSE